MGQDLENAVSRLFDTIARDQNTTVERLKTEFAREEIKNRREFYPRLGEVLSRPDLDVAELKDVIQRCWAVGGYDQIYFNEFVKEKKAATAAIALLIREFPEDEAEAAHRIETFIEEAIGLGYRARNGSQVRSGAAALTSVLLTALFPERFVDYRPGRWKKFARAVGYHIPYPADRGYGKEIIWAGRLAADIAGTRAFQQVWGTEHPLWSVAGIAWDLRDFEAEPTRNESPVPPDPRITTLLEQKKQVILYGPPGTGKTYSAKEYVSHLAARDYEICTPLPLDARIFSLTINIPRDGRILDLPPGAQFTYDWGGRRNWQPAFALLKEGDTALVYHSRPVHRFTTVVRCLRKEEESIVFEVLRPFAGPTFEEMKNDPVLKETDMMRTDMAFSLKMLQLQELRRVIKLSRDLTYESLSIELQGFRETLDNREFVTFHPSFGYEEFVEGLRPVAADDGSLIFRVEEGVFKEFSRRALNVLLARAGIEERWEEGADIPFLDDRDKKNVLEKSREVPFILIIDEINRGDISRIFGELVTLLEADKRYCEEHEVVATLPYSRERFAVPPNLAIIGTMNTADDSIALLDAALRRRFGFLEMMPDYNVLRDLFRDGDAEVREVTDIAVALLETINARIREVYDRDHQVGHSYLVRLKDAGSRAGAIELLHVTWYYEILPLLQEYFYDAPQRFLDVVGDRFISLSPDGRSFDFPDTLYGDEFLEAVAEIANGRPGPGA